MEERKRLTFLSTFTSSAIQEDEVFFYTLTQIRIYKEKKLLKKQTALQQNIVQEIQYKFTNCTLEFADIK